MENKQVVLFIEEAQGMPLDTLEEIRLLSNLETDQNKLLQIVLFGQPELDQNLAQQSIRQLRERITHNFNLEPLDQDEIHSYLNFRMREVGYTGPELINKSVAKKVEQHSDGLLRRINIIADKILLSAFAEGTHNLGPKHVNAAVNDSEFNQEAGDNSRILWWLGVLLLLALAFGVYQTRAHWLTAIVPESPLQIENTAINDKPVTDIVPREVETEPAEAQIEAEIEPESTAGLTTAELPAEQALPTADEGQQDEQVINQVEQVVSQVEAAVMQAETITQQTEDAVLVSLDDSPVLKKALDQAASSQALAAATSSNLSLSADYNKWLEAKLRESRDWLSQADRDKVSIQVLMRSKSAARELVYYLRHEWPLDISKTYLYEVSTDNRSIYRVFYSEYDSVTDGKNQLELLPESVKVNSPYLNSVYRMQKALL